jgi:serine/threonine protein kinase
VTNEERNSLSAEVPTSLTESMSHQKSQPHPTVFMTLNELSKSDVEYTLARLVHSDGPVGTSSAKKVYHALNVTTAEITAVKQVELPTAISGQDSDDEEQQQQGLAAVSAFKSERDTLSTLDHHHIVHLGFEETPTFLNMWVKVPQNQIHFRAVLLI